MQHRMQGAALPDGVFLPRRSVCAALPSKEPKTQKPKNIERWLAGGDGRARPQSQLNGSMPMLIATSMPSMHLQLPAARSCCH